MSDTDRANIEISASTNKLAQGLARARSMLGAFASTVSRGVGGAFGALNKKLEVGDVTKNALGHFGGNIATRGLDTLVGAAEGVRDFERNLVRFQITTNGSAASTAALRNQIRQVSKETGVAAEEVLAGASQYVALTGDAKGASTAMTSFARIAQASGASVSDVATATAALRTSMGISASQVEAVFSGMIVQGKAGAVELKDMAGELASLAPQFANFRGGKSVAGIREMGAAFQVIRTGAGSATEAATQFESLMGELAKPEVVRKLAALKIKVFDKDPKTGEVSMRNASDIFEDLAKSQKLVDPRMIAAIFGRKEAQQAIRSIRGHIDMYRELRTTAEDTGAVQRDLNTFLESDAGRLDQAMNNMKVAIAEAFTPERIQAFTNAVIALADKLGPVVDGVGKIADKLGGLYSIGQKVRGFLSGNENSNPWGGAMEKGADYDIANRDGAWIQTPQGKYVRRDSAEGRAQVTAAKLRMEHREGYDKTVKGILGSEKNDRTTNESIGAAIAAKHSENIGVQLAGDKYLQAAGIDQGKMQQIIQGAFKDAGAELAKQFQSALGALNINLDLSKDSVVDANRDSRKHRTRT